MNLPDDLMREVKIRAAQQNRTLQDLIAELLRRGLAQEPETSARPRRRVKLPLVHCAHAASPEEEMTPDRVADLLLQQEVQWALGDSDPL